MKPSNYILSPLFSVSSSSRPPWRFTSPSHVTDKHIFFFFWSFIGKFVHYLHQLVWSVDQKLLVIILKQKQTKQTSILSIILITLRSVKTIRHLSLEVFLRILTNQSLFFHSEVLDKLPYVFLTLLTVYHQQSAHVHLFWTKYCLVQCPNLQV